MIEIVLHYFYHCDARITCLDYYYEMHYYYYYYYFLYLALKDSETNLNNSLYIYKTYPFICRFKKICTLY